MNWQGMLFVADGYTLVGWIKAVPGLHPDVYFRYRAGTRESGAEYESALPAQRAKVAARLLARLVECVWLLPPGVTDPHDPRCEPFVLTEAQYLKLPNDVCAGMLDFVLCYTGPNVIVDTPDVGAMEKNLSPAAA
jgi:hypothetical protein